MSTTSASNRDRITTFLAGKGLTAAQIAGVEGNLQVESGFNPGAANPREGAVGIAQWEGGRRTGLDNYAKATGGSETNLDTQLGFLWTELTGSESGALSALQAATTPAAAATAFDQKYERSSPASLPTRVAAAESIAAGGITGGSGVITGGAGQGFTGNNAVGLLDPLGLGNLFSAISGQKVPSVSDGLTRIGHWIVDGLLIVAGLAMVIIGLVVLAKSTDDHNTPGPAATPGPGPVGGNAPEQQPHHGAKADAEGVAEDGAEVAA